MAGLKKPRLLLVLTEYPPSFGGMQTHAVELGRHLLRRGYEFEVATYRTPEARGWDEGAGYRVHRVLSRIGYHENLRVLAGLARRMRAEVVYSSTVFYGALSGRAGVPVVARSAGNDVLRPWIAWPYPWLSGLLSAGWVEDPLYARFRRLEWPERWERLLLERRWAEVRESARAAAHVLANSEFTDGLLAELGVSAERREVLAGGVDARRFRRRESRGEARRRLGWSERDYVLMTACRLVPKKGLDTVLAALAELPGVKLAVVGEGRERRRAEALAEELGVRERVWFCGRVEHGELARYYWAADQFVLASREHVDRGTGLRDVETMGRVLCEAMAAGTPVVAARSGGIPSVVEDGVNGLLFESGSAAGLRAAVERVRGDEALRAGLRENGVEAAERRFDWRVICAAHERAFARAAGRGSR